MECLRWALELSERFILDCNISDAKRFRTILLWDKPKFLICKWCTTFPSFYIFIRVSLIYVLDASIALFSFLADAYECGIVENAVKPLAKPRYNRQPTQTIYSCNPPFSSPDYEVHVLSVYEVINTRPPSAGNATVKIVIRARLNRPIILVLGSYEPVNWILSLPPRIIISKVILVSTQSPKLVKEVV